MIDQRVRWSLLPCGVMLAVGVRILIDEKCLMRLLEVLVWLMEAGHDAKTTAGGGRRKLRRPQTLLTNGS